MELTDEQRRTMEANRQAALRRRTARGVTETEGHPRGQGREEEGLAVTGTSTLMVRERYRVEWDRVPLHLGQYQ